MKRLYIIDRDGYWIVIEKGYKVSFHDELGKYAEDSATDISDLLTKLYDYTLTTEEIRRIRAI